MSSKRVTRSRAEIDEIIEEWRRGQLSVRKFAAERGLADSTLYQWIAARRVGDAKPRGAGKVETPSEREGFARIDLVEKAVEPPAPLTIVTRTDRRVIIGQGELDTRALRRVVEALEAC